MSRIGKRFKLNLTGKAYEGAIVQGGKYRFTVLTSRLIRIEYNEEGIFEDRPTQAVWNRQFEVPNFRVVETEDTLEIITENLYLNYDKGPLKENGFYIDVKGGHSDYASRWYYGQPANSLKGTYRTLDGADGPVELEEGIIAKHGFSYFDDGKSFVLSDDGWVERRMSTGVDIYFFGYGRDYLDAIKDLYRLTGPTPLLPRFALGNWWSRFWEYTEEELTTLINRFKAEDIPFSVCVMDMDWHVVDIPKEYGSGWTGYTWNKDFFPDPEGFMKWLHENNYKVTLNLHPADGVRPHEEMYLPMAKELGVDYENKQTIAFDIADTSFLEAYFKYLHHTQEERGVDFWWLDWQQGTVTKMEGLDPLWMINHYHTYDHGRDGKRPLIFSRYAGIGSHRYPIGFSGDTLSTWESLEFQPYFTSTASNVGYSWWSHDIGGHFFGKRDDELTTRWMQFGVFSPIMRLHSTKNAFNGKEPWVYGIEAEGIMKNYLRLRHQLIPYLYTMNYRTHKDLVPLVLPMYYICPNEDAAYNVPNQYMFGSELMVCPITTKTDSVTKLAHVDAYLPEGEWFDFFDGKRYKGGKNIRLFRTLKDQVVLAKEGGIIPMAGHTPHDNSIENPKTLEVIVFPGKSNTFEMYEDNGENIAYQQGEYVKTKIALTWEEEPYLVINKPEGDTNIIGNREEVKVHFRGIQENAMIKVYRDNKEIDVVTFYENITTTHTVVLSNYSVGSSYRIVLENVEVTKNENKLSKIFGILNRAEIEYAVKERVYNFIQKAQDIVDVLVELETVNLPVGIKQAILEQLTI